MKEKGERKKRLHRKKRKIKREQKSKKMIKAGDRLIKRRNVVANKPKKFATHSTQVRQMSFCFRWELKQKLRFELLKSQLMRLRI